MKKWNPFQSFHVTSTNENDPRVDNKSCDKATIIHSAFVCHCKNKLKGHFTAIAEKGILGLVENHHPITTHLIPDPFVLAAGVVVVGVVVVADVIVT